MSNKIPAWIVFLVLLATTFYLSYNKVLGDYLILFWIVSFVFALFAVFAYRIKLIAIIFCGLAVGLICIADIGIAMYFSGGDNPPAYSGFAVVLFAIYVFIPVLLLWLLAYLCFKTYKANLK